tara:strand:- start:820 stop:1077 length:258 start_codon:yes stop_codon:yes gene_type:complete
MYVSFQTNYKKKTGVLFQLLRLVDWFGVGDKSVCSVTGSESGEGYYDEVIFLRGLFSFSSVFISCLLTALSLLTQSTFLIFVLPI